MSLMLLMNLCGCSKAKLDYQDFNDNHILWEEVFTMDEESYFVYFYSTHCGHCQSIKPHILKFLDEHKDKSYMVKQAASFVFKDNPIGPIGIDNINEFYIVGVPSLCLINNHQVKEYYKGEEEIIGYIQIN